MLANQRARYPECRAGNPASTGNSQKGGNEYSASRGTSIQQHIVHEGCRVWMQQHQKRLLLAPDVLMRALFFYITHKGACFRLAVVVLQRQSCRIFRRGIHHVHAMCRQCVSKHAFIKPLSARSIQSAVCTVSLLQASLPACGGHTKVTMPTGRVQCRPCLLSQSACHPAASH